MIISDSLLLDLETTMEGKIIKIGAVFQDQTFERQGKFDLKEALNDLDRFGSSAANVLGHNLLGHDLPLLATLAPKLSLLSKPVIDTLYLSPLAFPENPYHRLVKDYKLIRQSVNDPVADARLAASIFTDQWEAFEQQDLQLLEFYRYCFENSEGSLDKWNGISKVFEGLGAKQIAVEDAIRSIIKLAKGNVCKSALRSISKKYIWNPEECATLAYCMAWLRVSGHNSVLPPWVRKNFNRTISILKQLRDIPCDNPDCIYCRTNHDPVSQLNRYFGFSSFRPIPEADDGSSLQEAIVSYGMSDRSQLAILPTGGGKSLCYQLPALVRNHRRGTLTIVISPLQALMKDQVDNLVANTGTPFAAALYGMLTAPERGQVLESVRLGDIALLYVSPEQLRNKTFYDVISQREIGCWVFDEAHCLSKWGHDFRTDYLYAARFIREFCEKQKIPLPPIACFTATAKKSVIEEIVDYFRRELGHELKLFEGGVERTNLNFEVQTVTRAEKMGLVAELLEERLSDDGAAVVYAATRKQTEAINEFLQAKGFSCDAFHAGLKPPIKKQIQDDFIAGSLQVIVATNAFGMGIDKENVRLVIHAEIPGSLENYLQEAGRAGRDQQVAECILLFDEQDIETQFKMGALSELSLRDIKQILRGLRQGKRNRDGEIVITAGELLRSETVETSFDTEDRQASTKVKAAVAWLERAGFLVRNENRTGVFQGRPAVHDLDEARKKIAEHHVSERTKRRWLVILEALINSDPDEGLSADDLAELPEFAEVPQSEEIDQRLSDSQRILKTLNDMAEAGLIKRDLLLTAFVRYKIADSSPQLLADACHLETALLQLLQEEEPNGEGWLQLSPRRVNQRLIDQGFICVPDFLLKILRSLSLDGKGLAGQRGSLDLVYVSAEHYRIKLHRGWDVLIKTAKLRSDLAKVLLDAIMAKIPPETSKGKDILVEFSLDDLVAALKEDLFLSGQVKNELAAIERALMFLHEQEVIVLQQGLAVFRQAMTIKLLDNKEVKKRQYTKGDYSSLNQHYRERTFQVHVMNEYARLGAEKIKQALGLVAAYFAMDQRDFVTKFFAGRKGVLERATGQDSYRRVVDNLGNPAQIAIVAAPEEENMLILAGPGSGKTRVVVHRCAYLLRVMRVPATGILILCFNRQAATTLRRRLWELVGNDAAGVTVLTYHGLAMRLTGTSFADRLAVSGDEPVNFDGLIDQAIRLLTGEECLPGLDEDVLRDRLLAGYRHILVDEYQDIDQRQYDLVSAIAGRTSADNDAKLTIMAVGDDDQNIYSFRGANITFIRKFEQDYQARYHHLVENFRSTDNIIAAGNALIAENSDRMKVDHPICINKGRERLPSGGDWSHLDPVGQGRVQLLNVADRYEQAKLLVGHLQRLKKNNPAMNWAECAVLSRTHEDLAPVRAALEHVGITVSYSRQNLSLPIGRVREIRHYFSLLENMRHELKRAKDLENLLVETLGYRVASTNSWWKLLFSCIEDWQSESGNAELPVSQAIDYLWEALAEQKRERFMGQGVFLSSVHFAKGTEFNHVFLTDGGWDPRSDDLEEERRVFYVGMTRAKQTLALFVRKDQSNPFIEPLLQKLTEKQLASFAPGGEDIPISVLKRRYDLIGMRDLFIDYAGRLAEDSPVHKSLDRLEAGSPVKLEGENGRLIIMDRGSKVAVLSKGAQETWWPRLEKIESVSVVAMVERHREDTSDLSYKEKLCSDRWEIPLLEVVWSD